MGGYPPFTALDLMDQAVSEQQEILRDEERVTLTD